ncbi:MAG: hypothetical protein FWG17_08300 [Desulfovibrionaceae bacterium]|nr:hypothetical protein [Desulfovibrionaceae bacterium]
MVPALVILILAAIAAGAAWYKFNEFKNNILYKLKLAELSNRELEELLDRYKNDRLYYTKRLEEADLALHDAQEQASSKK